MTINPISQWLNLLAVNIFENLGHVPNEIEIAELEEVILATLLAHVGINGKINLVSSLAGLEPQRNYIESN